MGQERKSPFFFPYNPPMEPLLPLLKEGIWKGRDMSICKPLLGTEQLGDVPLLAFGYDRPNTFEFLSKDKGGDFERLQKEAIANLRARPAKWRVARSTGGFLGFGKKPQLLIFDGDFFAAERVLDEEFLREAQRLLKTQLVAVGIPARGVIFAADGMPKGNDPHLEIGAFVAMMANIYRTSARDTAPISPTVFTAQDGKLIGSIRSDDAEKIGRESADQQIKNEDDKLYVSGLLVDENGAKAMHLLIGCDDVKLLRRSVVPHFLGAVDSVRERPDFGGTIKVVIMDNMTPDGPETREAVGFLNERLRGIVVEAHMKTVTGVPLRASVQYGMIGPN
jgi:hypothetical protein